MQRNQECSQQKDSKFFSFPASMQQQLLSLPLPGVSPSDMASDAAGSAVNSSVRSSSPPLILVGLMAEEINNSLTHYLYQPRICRTCKSTISVESLKVNIKMAGLKS
jgi:hypothetical protein